MYPVGPGAARRASPLVSVHDAGRPRVRLPRHRHNSRVSRTRMNIDRSERIPGRGAVMLALTLAVLGIPAAAQQGVITGHVTDAATKQGIALAQVTVVGTTL